ncbi:MAG: hypothetical protein JKX68_13845, partial [Flavobacteriales bacterium]|nr:hypothetical protein [Flavobacteriales bacterium]
MKTVIYILIFLLPVLGFTQKTGIDYSIEELEVLMEKAITNENHSTAAEYKRVIDLKKLLKKAVQEENYKYAAKLKKDIIKLLPDSALASQHKKTILKMGIVIINSFSDLRDIDGNSHTGEQSSGNLGAPTGFGGTTRSQPMISFFFDIPIYKNLSFFTSYSFNRNMYRAVPKVNRERIGLGKHIIYQHHIPIQIQYNYRLGKSNVSVSHRFGVTFTYHKEKITMNEPKFNPYGMINSDTISDPLTHTVTTNKSSITKIIPSLSGGIAIKTTNKKGGTFEAGVSLIYGINHSRIGYTLTTTGNDGATG